MFPVKERFIFAAFLIATGCYHVSPLDTDDTSFSDSDADTDSFYFNDTHSDSDSDSGHDSNTIPQINYCVALDGDGDYVRVPHNYILNLYEEWTIEAWVLLEGSTEFTQPIYRKGDEDTHVSAQYLYVSYDGNKPVGGFSYSPSDFLELIGVEAIPVGNWTHMAVSRTPDTTYFFINGRLVAWADTSAEGSNPNSDDLIFGAVLVIGNHYAFFKGQIDDIRVSSIARYTTDFTPSYAPIADDRTLALWRFSEGSGTETVDEKNSFTGTLNGDAHFVQCR